MHEVAVATCRSPTTLCAPGCGREVMQEAWETIKAMREEFQEQNNIYWAAEQEFRTWRNVDRERKRVLYPYKPSPAH